jgi:hypothetical protein
MLKPDCVGRPWIQLVAWRRIWKVHEFNALMTQQKRSDLCATDAQPKTLRSGLAIETLPRLRNRSESIQKGG